MGKKTRGGGVALAFRTRTCHFKERKIKNAINLEILCAVGNVGKINRKVVVFVLYIPPRTSASQAEAIRETLGTKIAAAKGAYVNPVLFVCCDINGRKLDGAFDVDDDISQIETGLTRGNSGLDVVFINIRSNIQKTAVLPPLETEEGVVSDHMCVEVAAVVPTVKIFTYIRKTTRKRSASADARFDHDLRDLDWAEVHHGDVDGRVQCFVDKISTLTDTHFPLQTTRQRSNEHPWITNGIRRRARRKRRLYRRSGRFDAWKRAEENMIREVTQKRQEFVEKILHLPSKSYYAAVKQLSGPDTKKAWSVTELFPGSADSEVGKYVLDYFAGVGGDVAPSPLPVIPRPRDAGLGDFDEARALELYQKHKKTTSTVPGDPMPHLVQKFLSHFAVPVAAIFNEVNRTSTWPSTWKKEYLTIIPKTPRPGSLSECRNISCTSYLSKVLEGVILEKLCRELSPDPDQFGGLKGCGAEHMMVELWDRILRVMDDGDQAACLLGIDFEKAFNRMDHGHCLRQLRALGASDESLALVASFLSGRIMTININGVNCGERYILRGSPQGSVLGCLLYCVTTQTLTDASVSVILRPGPQSMVGVPSPGTVSEASPPARRPRTRGDSTVGRLRFFPASDSEGDVSEDDIRFWESDSDLETNKAGELLPGIEAAKVKYVDDTTLFQSVPMSTAVRHISAGPTTETIRPAELETGLLNLAI